MRFLQVATAVVASLGSVHTTQAAPNAPLPVNFGMILAPNFRTLDVFGTLNTLISTSRTFPMKLSLIAPSTNRNPLISQAPTSFLANPARSDFGFNILATHNFTHPPKDLDVLLIPGGAWTTGPDSIAAVAYVKKVYPKLKYLYSVGEGSGIVARAGILDRKRATTNKENFRLTTLLRPQVKWVGKARWVVDGNVWSASGNTAGMDAILEFVSVIYGEEHSARFTNSMEYDRHNVSSWDPWAVPSWYD